MMFSKLSRERLLVAAIARTPLLSDGAKITFLCLVSMRVDQIPLSEIAMARGQDESTVQLHIKELKQHKFLSITQKGGSKKSASVYEYHPENVFLSLGLSRKCCRGIAGGNGHAIEQALDHLADPDFLFDLTKKLHNKIELPISNDNVRFLNKHREDYHRGDVVKYYRYAYKKRTGDSHRVANKRDLILCSHLLDRYDSPILCDVIDYALSIRGGFACPTFDVFQKNADRYFRQMSERNERGLSTIKKSNEQKTK